MDFLTEKDHSTRLNIKTINLIIMKHKITTIIILMATMLLTSCASFAQVSVSAAIDTGFGLITYQNTYMNYPVVYMQGVPYCRYFYDNTWQYRIIPVEHRHHIVHLDRPMEFRRIPVARHPRHLPRPHHMHAVPPPPVHHGRPAHMHGHSSTRHFADAHRHGGKAPKHNHKSPDRRR